MTPSHTFLMQALLFELAGRRYAVAADCVREVVRAVAVDPLPQAPAVITGVINYRGTVIAVIDARARLSLPTKPVTPEDHFVITQLAGREIALHIDAPIDLSAVSAVPLQAVTDGLVRDDQRSAYVAGVVPTQDGVLLIQDLPAFLSPTEMAQLDHALLEAAGAQGGRA